jgi:hypothetical protein
MEDHCDQPGGCAELSGPQLAWLAVDVPSITAAWGPSATSAGYAGRPNVFYGYKATPAVNTDGDYTWWLVCADGTPPPPPPHHGPAEPVCHKKPWLCDNP